MSQGLRVPASVPLVGNGATVTVSTPLLDLSQTWNDAAVVFTGIKLNVTSTGSAALALLMDLQVGGASKFKVDKTGYGTFGSGISVPSGDDLTFVTRAILRSPSNSVLRILNNAGTQSVDLTVGASNALTINGALTVTSAVLLASATTLTNGAAAQIATMTNGPTAGNPTKWVPINDNGTTRYIPAW